MSSIIEKCKKIDRLIRIKATGTPAELSKKIGVSETYAKNLIRYMRTEYGLPIKYSVEKGYIYTEKGGFYIGFQSD